MSGLASLERAAEIWLAFVAPRAFEATLLALVVLAVAAVRRIPANVRHGLLVVALIKFLMPPIVAPWSPEIGVAIDSLATRSAPLSATASEDGAAVREATDGHRAQAAGTGAPAAGSPDAGRAEGATPRSGRTAAVFAGASGGGERAPATTTRPLTRRSALVLLLAQAFGAIALLARHLRQRSRLRRLSRRCRPIRALPLRAAVIDASRRQGLRHAPTLLASPDRLGPAATGLLRRVIVLPTAVVDALTPGRLRPVIEHEVAHHRRGDLWVDLAIFLGSLVWWMNPIYWLVARRLRTLREECCDAVVAATVPASAYCQTLLDVAAALGGTRPALPALAHGTLTHPLGRRIRRMMDRSYRPRPKLSFVSIGLLLAVAMLVLPAATPPGAEPAAKPPQAATPPAPEPTATPLEVAASPAAERSATKSEAVPIATPSQASGQSGALPPETPFARSQSWIFTDDRIELNDGAIEVLVARGIDPEFAEQMRRATNRLLTLTEMREMSRHGFDPALADELGRWGIDRIELAQLLHLVILDADVDRLRSYREIGYDDIGVDGILRLTRYDVTADWITGWQDGGYDDLDVDDLVRLHRYAVRAEYAATYLEAGYELSVDDLVRLHRYAVDEHAAQRLADAGLDDFSVDDLVRLSRYGVDDQYIRAITEDGIEEIDVDGLVTLNRYGVTVEAVRAYRAAGIEPSVDDLVRLSRYGVAPELAAELIEAGHGPNVDDLVTLQRYGLDAATIRALAAATDRRFGTDELVRLKRYDVTPAWIRGMAEIGLGELPVDDMVRLKRYDVSADFVRRLQNGGFENLTVDRIIRLKRADG